MTTFTGAEGEPAGTAYLPITPTGALPATPVVSREDWTTVAIRTISASTTTPTPVTTRVRRRRSLWFFSLRIAAARTDAAWDSARRVEVDRLFVIYRSLRLRSGSSREPPAHRQASTSSSFASTDQRVNGRQTSQALNRSRPRSRARSQGYVACAFP